MSINNCAPIIIPTLCRYEHFKRCIESLQKNKLALQTELFIGLDYPAKETHWTGYKKIKEYIEQGIEGFYKVTVIAHAENKGADKNIDILRQRVYEEYEQYIFTEDDNEFSPNFLLYMNKYLEEYQNDDAVIAVTGYAYPVKYPKEDKVYFQNVYFAAYGYGTWKKKEKNMFSEMTLANYNRMLNDKNFMKSLSKKSRNQFCNFVKGMLGYGFDVIDDEEIRRIDINFGVWMFYRNKSMIFPTTSMVRNWGFDGSGVNCEVLNVKEKGGENHRTYDFSSQSIDSRKEYVYDEFLSLEETQNTEKSLNEFFEITEKEYIRTKIALELTHLAGFKKMRRLIKKI